ncbi:class I SAM-dependent methyltransferase [Saccharothrix coeruleofusca]|uniref:Methyltransferase n=1 Tax=Saccharothrix coeruleofusca TaxID=33919 RepID=A0A918AM40_9PSEU|nr:class I SAM-dependent methyltransferase [Saccharothrix coeruleofusca]GGP59602.1 methyltransferase [Saccharothrix coeruleofusca]
MTEPSYLTTTRASYDAVAAHYGAQYERELARRPLDRAMLAAFAELAGPGPVADVGCGPGHVTAHLRASGVEAFGVDLSPGMVARARELHPGLRFEEGSMTALGHADGSLTGVLAWYSLFHLPPEEVPTALAEFHRVLAPGGHLLLAFQLRDDHVDLDRWFDQEITLRFHRLVPDEVEELLRGAGFSPLARMTREPVEGEKPPRAYLLARK